MGSFNDIKLDRRRLTHIALHVSDIQKSIDWYERFTHLTLLDRRADHDSYAAWLADKDETSGPFILVLAQFMEGKDPFAPAVHHPIGPFAHIGLEQTTREAVDDIAALGKEHGCLALGPLERPAPVGYVCFLKDPDGNTIEYSYGQGVYDTFIEKWGAEPVA
ncbi:MAG: VOC family protein [Pseudomonadota bacterium]